MVIYFYLYVEWCVLRGWGVWFRYIGWRKWRSKRLTLRFPDVLIEWHCFIYTLSGCRWNNRTAYCIIWVIQTNNVCLCLGPCHRTHGIIVTVCVIQMLINYNVKCIFQYLVTSSWKKRTYAVCAIQMHIQCIFKYLVAASWINKTYTVYVIQIILDKSSVYHTDCVSIESVIQIMRSGLRSESNPLI